ncbi:MAG: hypothetical protein Q7R35_09615 [Elusimicrobiota bacterium]|nr:hypothetical protein [Elusimicrobiota bacterium]
MNFESAKTIFIKTAAAAALLLSAAQAGAGWDTDLEELQRLSAVDITAMAAAAPRTPEVGKAAVVTSACSTSKVFRFGGAYFRKLVTREGAKITGIQAEGALPLVSFDPDRYYTATEKKKDYQTGPLDRPSVYMGANSPSNELDCGLTWDRVYTSSGMAVLISSQSARFTLAKDKDTLYGGDGAKLASGGKAVAAKIAELKLKPELAFRPFWRTTGMGEPSWHNPTVGAPDNVYFHPGEKIKMAVSFAGGDNFRLDISAGERSFSVTFAQKGFQGKRSFKRINSIDQFRVVDGVRQGNENRSVIPTKTRVTGALWTSTMVLRGSAAPAAFTGVNCVEHRGRDTAARYADIFRASGWTDNGGENLEIIP